MNFSAETLSLMQTKEKLIIFFTDGAMWGHALIVTIKILFILIAARFIVKIGSAAIERSILNKETLRFDTRRTKTIARLVRNILTYTVYFIALLLVLGQMNFNLAPLLAGAGVLGLAIGFGAQNLVRDVITGFFIIFEDQFAVGDMIQTGNFKGVVEEIGLRITKIRNWTGEIHIIPNGSIVEVTNFSIHNSVAVVDISVAYEADIDQAMKVIQETVKVTYKDDENMVKEPEVLGVQTLGASDVIIRVVAECKPMTQFVVARKMNAELKKALDKNGIEIPYPRVVTYHRQDA